jgi:hypothetical protein
VDHTRQGPRICPRHDADCVTRGAPPQLVRLTAGLHSRIMSLTLTTCIAMTRPQGAWKTGSPVSMGTGPKPCIPRMSWTRLTSSHNNNSVGGRQGSLIRTAADGTVYVFWEGAIDHHSELQVAISHDGGETFGQPQPVQPVVDIPSPLPGSSFRTDSFPSADVNQVTGEIHRDQFGRRHPQPGSYPLHAPAGLVRDHHQAVGSTHQS